MTDTVVIPPPLLTAPAAPTLVLQFPITLHPGKELAVSSGNASIHSVPVLKAVLHEPRHWPAGEHWMQAAAEWRCVCACVCVCLVACHMLPYWIQFQISSK